jgi:VWFA-related protein
MFRPGLSTIAYAAPILAAALQAPQAPAPHTPFKSGVEIVAVDVQVVDSHGTPIDTLRPEDFDVTIDGKARHVASANLTRYASRQVMPDVLAPGTVPLTNVDPKIHRIFVLAIDEESFYPLQARAAVLAAGQFIDKLEADDYVGAYGYPIGALGMDITRDHEKVKKDMDHVVGLLDVPYSQFHMSPSEIIDIDAGDSTVLAQVVARECGRNTVACRQQVLMESKGLSTTFENQAARSFGGLRNLIDSMAIVPGRKTLVVVSGGLMVSDRIVGHMNLRLETESIGHDALYADTSIYVLQLDGSFLDAFSPRSPKYNQTLLRDAGMKSLGLEMLALDAGGALIHVEGTQPERAFDRVNRETSAYYLLAVEPLDADRDGKPHAIKVKVQQKGADVRSRAMVTIPKKTQ